MLTDFHHCWSVSHSSFVVWWHYSLYRGSFYVWASWLCSLQRGFRYIEVRYIEVPSHTFYCNFGWAEEYRSLYRGLHYIQGLEGVLRDPGFVRNWARDSGIQKKSSRDLWILYRLWRGIFFICSPWFVISTVKIPWIPCLKDPLLGKNDGQTKSLRNLNTNREWMWMPTVYLGQWHLQSLLFDISVISWLQ